MSIELDKSGAANRKLVGCGNHGEEKQEDR